MDLSKITHVNGLDLKHKILSFLKEQFFDPISNADESSYSEYDRQLLKSTKKQIKVEQKNLEQKAPADMLRHLDGRIESEYGRTLNKNLTSLNLPNFTSIKIRLMHLKDQLGL